MQAQGKLLNPEFLIKNKEDESPGSNCPYRTES